MVSSFMLSLPDQCSWQDLTTQADSDLWSEWHHVHPEFLRYRCVDIVYLNQRAIG